MCDLIATKLSSRDFLGFVTVTPEQPPEESLRCSSIPSGLEIHINNLAVLVHSPPEKMLLPINLHKDFINVQGITTASMLSFQSACINGTELDAPKANGLAADSDASFGQQIFDIAVA